MAQTATAHAIPPSQRASATINNAYADRQSLTFDLDVSALPAGATVDPRSVTVLADGHTLTATAAPSGPGTAEPGTSGEREAVLVLDTSGSMQGPRLAAAKAAALSYAKAVPTDVKIGLVTFSDRPAVIVPPTTDRGRLGSAIQQVTATGNTALYDAVKLAIANLGVPGANDVRRLLILSDGEDNTSASSLASTAAVVAAGKVRVDAVGLAVSAGQQSVLAQLTGAGSGQVIASSSLDELTSAFVRAAQSFNQRVSVTADLPASLAGKQISLLVSVLAGGAKLTATTTVTVPLGAESAGGFGSAPGHVPYLLLALVFFGILAIALALLLTPDVRDKKRHRLDHLDDYSWAHNSTMVPVVDQNATNAVTGAALRMAGALLRSARLKSSLTMALERAGVRRKPQEWLLLEMSAGVVGFAMFFVLFHFLLAALLLGIPIGWGAARAVLLFKASRRASAFSDQLPDNLQLVASSLRAGFSLPQALDGVIHQGLQPAAAEYSRALAENRLGVELEDALDAVAERMRCQDLAWVVMAVRISREVGGNLAEVLLTTVQTMRARAQLKRQVRALSAEGRLSAYVLIALPILVAGWLILVRRAYLRPLYTEPMGLIMLTIAAFGMVVGTWWMSRIVKVKV